MKQLLEALDQVKISNARYKERVPGEHVDVAPPNATKTTNRARRWMVSDEWYDAAENEKYRDRILANGKL